MTEEMASEFDTVAWWTGEVALDLGADYYIPAGCRGSGRPSALEGLIDTMSLSAEHVLLDVGAGVGGPAALAHDRAGVRPVLLEPEPGACRAAARLFGFPVVRGGAPRLPLRTQQFSRVWCLGVLCTTDDHVQLLRELARVMTPDGRLGLLVFAATTDHLSDQPEGNNFPAADSLGSLARRAGLSLLDTVATDDLAPAPPAWTERAARIDEELNRRHFEQDAWKTAQEQSRTFAGLLERGELVSQLLVLRHG
jgi:SAM-dependent methyltransferase